MNGLARGWRQGGDSGSDREPRPGPDGAGQLGAGVIPIPKNSRASTAAARPTLIAHVLARGARRAAVAKKARAAATREISIARTGVSEGPQVGASGAQFPLAASCDKSRATRPARHKATAEISRGRTRTTPSAAMIDG